MVYADSFLFFIFEKPLAFLSQLTLANTATEPLLLNRPALSRCMNCCNYLLLSCRSGFLGCWRKERASSNFRGSILAFWCILCYSLLSCFHFLGTNWTVSFSLCLIENSPTAPIGTWFLLNINLPAVVVCAATRTWFLLDINLPTRTRECTANW